MKFNVTADWSSVIANLPVGGLDNVDEISIQFEPDSASIMIRGLFVRACGKGEGQI